MTAAEIGALLPALVVIGGAFALLLADMVLPASRKSLLGEATLAVLAAALAAVFAPTFEGPVFSGAWQGGPWTQFFQVVVLVSAFLSVLGGLSDVAAKWPHRQGEYHFLLLMSLSGMMLLPGARDLILLVVCFELMGIPLYLLASYGKVDATTGSRGAAAEAGLKLYLVGAASSGIALFGLALVAGLARGTSLEALAAARHSPLLSLGILLTLAGMAFKIGVAPFHAWVPDTYQGASTPFVAFLSVAPKAAGFAALVAVFVVGLPAMQQTWLPAIAVLSLLTLILGNLLAIPQSNVKRILAYSGVAQVGYVLMGLAAGPGLGLSSLLFYLAAYVVTNAGAFLVAHAVALSDGDESASGLAGLARRSPWLALSLLLFLLSLAGIPFVAGFWAKLYVFIAAWQAGLWWLVLAGAVLAVAALFYYLGLAKAAYVEPPTRPDPVRVAPSLRLAIIACLIGVVGIGAWPRPVQEAAERAAAWLAAPAGN